VPLEATEERVLPREQKNGLDGVLAAEGPGILAWAVKGCLSWQERGLVEPEAVVRATLAYREAEDALNWFQRDVGLRFDRGASVSAGAVTDKVQDWSASEGVKISARDLRDWLEENGATKRRLRQAGSGQEYRWLGVCFEN
jgi:putative DNA primase/helicase